jgi:hypothetical protein
MRLIASFTDDGISNGDTDEPELQRFSLTWRVVRPLRKNMHEIAQVLVGKKGREWWQQRGQVEFPIPVIMVPMERKPDEVDA